MVSYKHFALNDRGLQVELSSCKQAWQPQWMCMRCHNELQLEHICVPDPTPACPLCLTLMLWEVDLARRQERWVCSRCPYARSARPLALGAAPPCDLPDLPSPAPQRAAPAPALAPTQYTTLGPPPLPLRDGTNSALYVPLLLDAAGMLAAQAQRDWRSRAPINEWWPAAVDALRARACIPVQELSAAVEHVALAFAPPVLHSASVLRFRAWAAERPGHVTSLAELVRAIAVAPEGHYIAAPLQEALLTLLVGPAAVTTFARLIEGLRARPVDAPSLPPPPAPHDAAPAAVRRQDDAPLVPPDAPASAAQHAEVPHVAGADREPAADFVGSAAARIVQLERRARGRGRRGGRGRGRGRRASPAARVDDTPVEDEQSVPHVSTASQRRVLSAEAAFRAGLQSLDAIDLAATLRRRILTLQSFRFRFRFRPSESADEDYDPIRTWGIKNTRSSRFVTVQLGQTR